MKGILLILFVAMATSTMAQQAQSPAEVAMARMRDAMKKLTQRIAEADAATATAQAAQIAAEAKAKDLEGKITDLTKNLKTETEHRKSDKETSEKAIKDLESKLDIKTKEVAALTESLTKWKAGFEKARDVANAKEGERAEAANKAIAADRKAQEHERKNREMYKLGTEILERYKSFGLGTALLAKEPFTGSMRVKFQNYVNDYGDKLGTQRIKQGESQSVGTAAAKTDASPEAKAKPDQAPKP